ncbi:MAG: N-acetylmuramic acid 6-phosphate etherase [Geminicoccaceae bacterium]|nr:N-acetylmuramic acid 6-phosphate etherase [Geminicoccaceae bacterium]
MIATEGAASRYTALETWNTGEMVDTMLEGQLAAISAVHAVRSTIARAVDAATVRLERGGRLFYLGAGTSGRIATLDAAELIPTFNWPAERVISIMAGGERAFTTPVEGAEDDEDEVIRALTHLGLCSDDVVIGLAASGRTPFAISGLRHGQARGALTIGVLNSPGGPLASVSDIAIEVDSGAEVLAGSTRMKAGTAQKAVLTTLSTGIFLRMGYVYRGRMVEMKPTNEKLHKRAAMMVMELSGSSLEAAKQALAASDNSIKLAIIMLRRQLDIDEARTLLEKSTGRLHLALESA